MRISVQACIEGEGERPSRINTVGVIERDDEFAPSSGLGLFMSEAVGERLEMKAQRAKWAAAMAPVPRNRPALTGLPVLLQIDAGYIKATRSLEGNRWIPVVVSKIFRPETPHTHAHAYANGPDLRQGLRQQAFLQSIRDLPQAEISHTLISFP